MKRSKTKGTSQMTGPEDEPITGLIRRGLSSAGGTGAAEECPEPEVLAAYYDHALEPAEAARAEAHFSDCASCRAQLAALVRSDVPERKTHGLAWLWDWRLLVPAAALGAGVLAVWIAVHPFSHRTQQVAVKLMPSVPQNATENPAQPPAVSPPAGSAAQSSAAPGAAERRKSANVPGGKAGG
jgi:Putative zinc-finger